MEHDLDTAVVDWVIDFPRTEPLFREMGIDYTCGGKSLRHACREKGHDERIVMSKLREIVDESARPTNGP